LRFHTPQSPRCDRVVSYALFRSGNPRSVGVFNSLTYEAIENVEHRVAYGLAERCRWPSSARGDCRLRPYWRGEQPITRLNAVLKAVSDW
jgi:hypothetical protein